MRKTLICISFAFLTMGPPAFADTVTCDPGVCYNFQGPFNSSSCDTDENGNAWEIDNTCYQDCQSSDGRRWENDYNTFYCCTSDGVNCN